MTDTLYRDLGLRLVKTHEYAKIDSLLSECVSASDKMQGLCNERISVYMSKDSIRALEVNVMTSEVKRLEKENTKLEMLGYIGASLAFLIGLGLQSLF